MRAWPIIDLRQQIVSLSMEIWESAREVFASRSSPGSAMTAATTPEGVP
jgi:hypothetical protein